MHVCLQRLSPHMYPARTYEALLEQLVISRNNADYSTISFQPCRFFTQPIYVVTIG